MELKKGRWPSSIPQLRAADFVHGTWRQDYHPDMLNGHDPMGVDDLEPNDCGTRCCLGGWVAEVFPGCKINNDGITKFTRPAEKFLRSVLSHCKVENLNEIPSTNIIDAAAGLFDDGHVHTGNPDNYNEAKCDFITQDRAARAWRSAMKDNGYTEASSDWVWPEVDLGETA